MRPCPLGAVTLHAAPERQTASFDYPVESDNTLVPLCTKPLIGGTGLDGTAKNTSHILRR